MKATRSKVWTVAALVALSTWGCSRDEGGRLAVVGDHVITAEEFQNSFGARPRPFASYESELEQRREFLDGMINQRLLVVGAYQQGFDEDPEIQRQIEMEKNKLLLDQLYQQEIVDQITVSEAEIQDWYDHMGEEIHAQHILVDAREAADSVRAELLAGADFRALAQARSQDPSATQNGGDLGWFGWGSMVAPFQEAAFALAPDALSEPVQTDFGWHVIQLLERRPVDRRPFDQVEAGIQNRLREVKTRELLSNYLAEVKERADLQIDPDQLAIVQETYRDTLGPLLFETNPDPERLNEKVRIRPFARYLDTILTTGDFITLVTKVAPPNRPSLYDTTAVKDLVFKMVYTHVLEREARRVRVDHSEAYKRKVRQVREAMMAEKMRADLVARPVSITSAMIQGYYDEHPEEFSSPPQVRLREALVGTREEAQQIMTRVRRGARFEQICAEVTLRPGMKAKKGDLGAFRRFQYPSLFDAAQRLDEGQVGGPVFHSTKDGGQWSVIQVLDKQDASTKPLADAEEMIRNKLREEAKQQVMEDWFAEMRDRTSIQINEEALVATIDKSRYAEQG
jgi:parvulin-like peptidyl-prolyl isomerase